MFCRFGLIEDRRPVAVVVCWNVVCRRPSSPIQFGQRVEVGLGELGQLAPALDLGDDRVLVADRLQHARVGGEAGLAAALARELELVEQHAAELLRRADHELLARQLPDLALERGRRRPDARWRPLEPLGVELDAGLLRLAQDAHERQLDLVEQVARGRARGSARRWRPASSWIEHGASSRELVVLGVGGDARAPRQLVERVAAARGVEQVGGDLGVEARGSAGRRRAPWRRGRRPARSPAACDELGRVVASRPRARAPPA